MLPRSNYITALKPVLLKRGWRIWVLKDIKVRQRCDYWKGAKDIKERKFHCWRWRKKSMPLVGIEWQIKLLVEVAKFWLLKTDVIKLNFLVWKLIWYCFRFLIEYASQPQVPYYSWLYSTYQIYEKAIQESNISLVRKILIKIYGTIFIFLHQEGFPSITKKSCLATIKIDDYSCIYNCTILTFMVINFKVLG